MNNVSLDFLMDAICAYAEQNGVSFETALLMIKKFEESHND
jgi:hypothetical protein